MNSEIRKIIHIDMDAFYASVEQRDNPSLRGKAVAVGGKGRRGVVSAASYEARKFGVRSAMPSLTAERLCPHLIFLKPRFDVYRAVSKQIQAIFYDYTDLVEPLSLDEAFLDVTTNKVDNPSATLLAKEIRKRILQETGLTASAGISFNKFLAKIASDLNKPNGQAVIEPKDAEKFLEELPIRKFFGIGAATAEKMKRLGIENGDDLKKYSEVELIKIFGKSGAWYYKIVRGQDDREVKPDRIRKSVGAERTFKKDLTTESEMIEKLDEIIDIEIERLKRVRTSGTTITLKIKYNNFDTKTRSKTIKHPVRNKRELREIVMELLHTPFFPDRPVRLLGVTLSNLTIEHENHGQMVLELKEDERARENASESSPLN